MNTRELLIKLAGNDRQKQLRAEQWATMIWSIGCELTEAQGKVLLNEPCPDEEGGTIYALEHAINLREPVFLKTTVDLLWNTDAMYLCKVLDVLNKDAQRQLLKAPENFMNLLSLIDVAAQYRGNAAIYTLWTPSGVIEINSIYRAAWYILDAYSSDYQATVTERYSLKKIKAVLKTPERIDRYAQIEHVEYDYTSDVSVYIRTVLDMSGLNYHLFINSEELAEEGAMMHNCIASYWDKHTKSTFGNTCFVLSAEYKGQHIDIELCAQRNEVEYSSYYITVEQIRLEYNESLEKNDEKRIIALIGDAAIELFNDQQRSHTNITRRLTGETACYRYEMLPNLGITLYDEFGFGEQVYTGRMFSVMEGMDDAHGPYIYTPNCLLRIVRLTPDIIEVIDITGTPEGCAAADIYCSKFGTLDD